MILLVQLFLDLVRNCIPSRSILVLACKSLMLFFQVYFLFLKAIFLFNFFNHYLLLLLSLNLFLYHLFDLLLDQFAFKRSLQAQMGQNLFRLKLFYIQERYFFFSCLPFSELLRSAQSDTDLRCFQCSQHLRV